ncbi:39S ribosomal protein L10, mitochondrial [Passer montanus]|uniref:39S ribosomal protein L10, mitochondrial n=1 Tax=Passer montanus TaxID=9160 RepID=UPI00195F6573|nr:39S ribosomal protein L10, mitochondrial [Passer montanus]
METGAPEVTLLRLPTGPCAVAAKMAALGSGGARWRQAWLPALQLLRRGSKAVTRHWKAMHFQRQKLLALTEYLPPRAAPPPRCRPRPPAGGLLHTGAAQGCPCALTPCPQEDGYARVLQAQLQAVLRASRMVAVCQYNSMAEEDVATLRHFLRRHDIHVKFVLNEVARPVLEQSKWRSLLPLFVCRNILLVSAEPRAREMLRVLKGVPQVNLLGACIDDTILSRQGVEGVARLPPLEVSQGQTVAALALLCSQTPSLLQQGPARLTALLEQHMQRLRGPGSR